MGACNKTVYHIASNPEELEFRTALLENFTVSAHIVDGLKQLTHTLACGRLFSNFCADFWSDCLVV